MSRRYALLAALVVLACGPTASNAQEDVRTITTARRLGDEEALSVWVGYGAGRLSVRSGDATSLYRARLQYDAAVFRPVSNYEPGRLRIGLEGMEGLKLRRNYGERGRLDLQLGTGVPLDLDLNFGAVEAEIELGGLRLRKLDIETGASDTKVRFSQPNPDRMRIIEVSVGAASFRMTGIANANPERFHLDGGVGEIVLDFTGEWRGDIDADIDMGLGSLRIVVPRGLGVRVHKSGFLASFDSQGLEKRGDSYYSRNWENAPHRLTLTIDAAFGSIEMDWVEVEDGGATATF